MINCEYGRLNQQNFPCILNKLNFKVGVFPQLAACMFDKLRLIRQFERLFVFFF